MRTELVLASASPRRLELLRSIGLEPRVRPADLDERHHAGEAAVDYAARLAREKAAAVATHGADAAAILAADTVVVVDEPSGAEQLLGKPVDAADARRMLTALGGRSHRVVTAFHVIGGGRSATRVVTTEVEMRHLESTEIDAYVDSREWEGKAGGYAVQGLAAAFVRGLRGSYTSVVGLPLSEVVETLRELDLLAVGWAPHARGAAR